MINNTSVQKWDRLAQKQLDRQFMNEIVHGLQCSPFEAKAILERGNSLVHLELLIFLLLKLERLGSY